MEPGEWRNWRNLSGTAEQHPSQRSVSLRRFFIYHESSHKENIDMPEMKEQIKQLEEAAAKSRK